jgi:hypothetical protein
MAKRNKFDLESCKRMFFAENASHRRTVDALEYALKRENAEHDRAHLLWLRRMNRAAAREVKAQKKAVRK